VSLAGNLILMRLLVGSIGLQPLVANAIAVLACAAINFAGADRMVFAAPAPGDAAGGGRGRGRVVRCLRR
jgi:hypothetical protein